MKTISIRHVVKHFGNITIVVICVFRYVIKEIVFGPDYVRVRNPWAKIPYEPLRASSYGGWFD